MQSLLRATPLARNLAKIHSLLIRDVHPTNPVSQTSRKIYSINFISIFSFLFLNTNKLNICIIYIQFKPKRQKNTYLDL